MKKYLLLFVITHLVLLSYSITIYPELLFNPLDLYLGNDTTICSGESLLLDAGPGYDSYLWQDGSTEQTYLVTDAGIYWVHAWMGTTMYADTITISIWPEPDPDLGSDTTLCFGESLLLEPGVGFAAYLWMDGSNLPFYVANQTGVYWVTVTDMHGCTASDTIVVDIVTNIVDLGNDTVICECGSVLLDAGEGFVSYEWQDGSILQYFLVDGGIFGVGTHVFSVTVVDSNDCESTDEILVYIDEHTNVAQTKYGQFQIYPNPANDVITIDLQGFLNERYTIEVLDSYGRVVEMRKFRKNKMQESIFIDVKNQPEGIYLVKVSSSKIVVSKKLLIR